MGAQGGAHEGLDMVTPAALGAGEAVLTAGAGTGHGAVRVEGDGTRSATIPWLSRQLGEAKI